MLPSSHAAPSAPTISSDKASTRSSPTSRGRKRLRNLPAAETVLFAVGFDRAGGQSIEDVYAGGMRNVLAALPADTGRFIYISTTGVYGPAGGEWVDEETPPDPQRDGGRASLAAEQALARTSARRAERHPAAGRHLRPGPRSVSRQAARRRADPSAEYAGT